MLRMKVDEDDEMMMVGWKQHDRGRYDVIPVNVHYHGDDDYDEDDGDDDKSEGFFLQCGVVPASIMPTSDPLSAHTCTAVVHHTYV